LDKGRGIRKTEVLETGIPCIRYGELYEMVLKYRTGNFCNFQSNETRNEYEEEVQKV